MRDLVLDAPLLQVALALTVVVAAAALLYRVDRGNRHIHGGVRAALGVLRALCLATLALLLFRPVLRSEERTETQPLLLLLQDQSQSVAIDHDGWSDTLRGWWNALPSESGQPGARVEGYSFGADLEPWSPDGPPSTLDDPVTNLTSALDLLEGQWAGRPIGAVVIATDGRFNRGRDPERDGVQFGAPVHIIRLGDTTLRKDIRIDRLLHNDVAGLGNRFPIEVEIGAQGHTGSVDVTLSGSGVRESRRVDLQPGGAPTTLTFLVEAASPGIQRYVVRVSDHPDEVNTANNRKTVTVDVIERRKRILLASPAPHPDRGAWANALSGNANYEVVQSSIEDLTASDAWLSEEWDGLLLFSFDAGNDDQLDIQKAAAQAGWPIGFVIDPDGDLDALVDLGIGLDFQATRSGLTTDPRGALNPAFPHFQVNGELETMLAEVPPLVSPFGEGNWGPAHTPLLFQRIGGIVTDDPLLTVSQTEEGRRLVLLGEGSWRWRQVGYLRTGSHTLFDDLVGKLVQYLTSDPGVDRFRVDAPRLLDEDQRLTFQARVYDATLNPLPGADIALQLTDSTGTRFDYRFSAASTGGYSLDAGRLPEGRYRWAANTEVAGERFDQSGVLDIRGIRIESNGRPAQHDLLRRMAAATGGITVAPDGLDALTETLMASSRFTPELSLSERLQDLIGWKALLAFLVGLLAVEWLVRRWVGTY